MKKIIIVIVSTLLTFVFCLGGCNQKTPIAFSTITFGATELKDAPNGYTEVCEYDVSYAEEFRGEFIKTESIPSNVIFEYSNGKLITKLETLKTLPSDITTDISMPLESTTYYKYTTNFNIHVHYDGLSESYDGAKDFDDQIITTAYFCSARYSYAPIFSKVESSYTALNFTNDGAKVTTTKFENTIKYNKEKYVIEKTTFDGDMNKQTQEPKEYKYDFQTVCDNTQIMFLMRNTSPTSEQRFNMPTVTPEYGESKTLGLNLETTINEVCSLTVNGEKIENENIKLKDISFGISDSVNTGIQQKIFLQAEASENVPFNSLLVKYVRPLITFGSISTQGALVYTLSSVNVSTVS